VLSIYSKRVIEEKSRGDKRLLSLRAALATRQSCGMSVRRLRLARNDWR